MPTPAGRITATRDTKEVRDDGVAEIVVWRIPEPLAPCTHFYKYRLYFGAGGHCRVRYDNERGKGGHRHVDGREQPYPFVSLMQLLDILSALSKTGGNRESRD